MTTIWFVLVLGFVALPLATHGFATGSQRSLGWGVLLGNTALMTAGIALLQLLEGSHG